MAITSGVGPHAAWINGFLITHGTVIQNANRKSSTFSVTVAMFEPGALGAFANPGDAVVVVQGVTNTGPLITGEIDTVNFDFIGTTIHITGRDKSAKLHNLKSAEKFQNKMGSDIVQELVGRAGLGAGNIGGSTGQAGKKLEQDFVKLTDSISLSTVIHLLGQFDGARWFVDKDGMFNYESESGGGGSYSVFYKEPSASSYMVSDCLALRVKLNAQAMKGAKVKVLSWHPKDKKLYTGMATAGGGGGGGGEPIEYTYHIPTLDQSHADQHAKARAKEHSRHAIEVVATVIGDPSINVNGMLQLSGTPFSGSYEIDNIHHAFGMGGYTMTITAKSPGQEGGGGGGGGGE
jgi:hypothetical protein